MMKIQSQICQNAISLLVTCLLVVSAKAQNSNLTGHIIGLGSKPVVFGYTQDGIYKLDTVYAINDRFTYLAKPSDDGLINLRISRPRYTSFWYEPGEIAIDGSVDKPYKLVIRGGLENNTLTQYKQEIEWLYDDKTNGRSSPKDSLIVMQERNSICDFIRRYPATKTSAHLLYWQLRTNNKDVGTHENLFANLSPSVQESFYGKEALKSIQIINNQPVIGKVVPSFTAPDTTGKTVSLTTFKGRYVLLDFWGHWCGPCIGAFPKLKDIQKKYGDKLVIIGIAAEFKEDRSDWIRAIKKYNADWIHLSDLKADKGAVNETYNVSAFPTYFLLNKEGVLLEKSLNIKSIEEKLASLGELN